MYVSVRDTAATGGLRATRSGRVATTVILLGIVSLLTDISSEMVNAVLPLYLTTQVGLGLFAYGFVDGLYQGVSASVRIAGGLVSDLKRRPKWVAVLGYGVSALTRIALLPAHGLATISAVVTADRLGKGLRTAPRDALIAAASPPEMLGRSFGVHRMLDTIGAAIGPVLAFVLLYLTPNRFDPIFVAAFAFGLIGVAVLLLFVPDRRIGAASKAMRLRDLGRQITAPALRRPMLAAGLLGLFTIGDGFLYLSLQKRDDFAAVYFPLLFVGTNLVYLTLAVPMGRLADRIGRPTVFLAGHGALLLVYLASGARVAGVASTLLVLALLGVFYAATDGVLAAMTSAAVPEESRGTGIAAVQTVVAVARFASSLLFGGIWMIMGRSSALMFAAGALALMLAVATWLLRPMLGPPDRTVAAPASEPVIPA